MLLPLYFNILSKGGFISSNSVSTQVKRLYDVKKLRSNSNLFLPESNKLVKSNLKVHGHFTSLQNRF